MLLAASIALFALSLATRVFVGYQTDPDAGINGIVVLRAPGWDAAGDLRDKTWFWLNAGNENYVEGEELYFWNQRIGWVCFLLAASTLACVRWLTPPFRSARST